MTCPGWMFSRLFLQTDPECLHSLKLQELFIMSDELNPDKLQGICVNLDSDQKNSCRFKYK